MQACECMHAYIYSHYQQHAHSHTHTHAHRQLTCLLALSIAFCIRVGFAHFLFYRHFYGSFSQYPRTDCTILLAAAGCDNEEGEGWGARCIMLVILFRVGSSIEQATAAPLAACCCLLVSSSFAAAAFASASFFFFCYSSLCCPVFDISPTFSCSSGFCFVCFPVFDP